MTPPAPIDDMTRHVAKHWDGRGVISDAPAGNALECVHGLALE